MTTTTAPEQPKLQSERDPMRFHLHYRHGKSQGGASPYAGGSSFMERGSEAVASGVGTVAFLVVSSAIILAWVLVNPVTQFLGNSCQGPPNGEALRPPPVAPRNPACSAGASAT